MYAIIETGGKQVRVEVGQKICVEKINAFYEKNHLAPLC